ncbi:hypothetical protein EV368DRAFT_90478 [Lentinula lateritia]|nr:hypothetical protein EV368DRAFT_90478 [Lentinula lateritia]
MSPAPARPISRTPSPLLPPLTALREVPSPVPESDGEVERDQLAFTIESPSRPQLQLGGSLSLYQLFEDPNLGKILRYQYFGRRCNEDLAYSRRFLELHGTPAHQLMSQSV